MDFTEMVNEAWFACLMLQLMCNLYIGKAKVDLTQARREFLRQRIIDEGDLRWTYRAMDNERMKINLGAGTNLAMVLLGLGVLLLLASGMTDYTGEAVIRRMLACAAAAVCSMYWTLELMNLIQFRRGLEKSLEMLERAKRLKQELAEANEQIQALFMSISLDDIGPEDSDAN